MSFLGSRLRPDDRRQLADLRSDVQRLTDRVTCLEQCDTTIWDQLGEVNLHHGETDKAVRTLKRDMRAVAGPIQAVAVAMRNIARALKLLRLERMEQYMSEQLAQLTEALAGNESKFSELQQAIAAEAAQVTAEIEAIRGQVGPNLQPAIESVLAHQQRVTDAIAQVTAILPDAVPEPPIPSPPNPEPNPERRRR